MLVERRLRADLAVGDRVIDLRSTSMRGRYDNSSSVGQHLIGGETAKTVERNRWKTHMEQMWRNRRTKRGRKIGKDVVKTQ